MALGSTIETLTVEQPPAKTAYAAGEHFDPAGLKVTARFANGAEKDVTQYLSWSADALTADDTEFELRYEHVLYQDRDGAAGSVYPAPSVTVSLTVSEGIVPAKPDYTPGDVDQDGEISSADARLALRRSVSLENYPDGSVQFLACDVDLDGSVTSGDARLILRASVGLEDPLQWKKR